MQKLKTPEMTELEKVYNFNFEFREFKSNIRNSNLYQI